MESGYGVFYTETSYVLGSDLSSFFWNKIYGYKHAEIRHLPPSLSLEKIENGI